MTFPVVCFHTHYPLRIRPRQGANTTSPEVPRRGFSGRYGCFSGRFSGRYVKRLSDVDTAVPRELVEASVAKVRTGDVRF